MKLTQKVSRISVLVSLATAVVCAGMQALPVSAQEDTVNISPIVQLVSYKNIYGKYVEMYGWGSASIINKNGIIISNNHVVDDGKGKLASAFNICITKKSKEKPACDYTATLIARDDMRDVSMLKIDPVDIYGNQVDYTKFKTIDIDFSYVPKTQDDAVLIGYPWVGAETITETKGIVSGTVEYNGYKYIKTDATIAGGNSGGAMVNKDGKLIGIPTYSMGGFFDSSLGYALSIKEAEGFINDNINKAVESKKTTFNFSEYQKTLENLNKAQMVDDNLMKFTFGADYEVKNYIKNRYLDFNTKTQKEVNVNINMELASLPNITNEKHFWYYIQNLGLYSRESDKLNKKVIGGISFYTPVSKSDVSQGNSTYITQYFAKISPKLLLKLDVYAPLYDEKNNDKVKAEAERVLAGFMFKTDAIATLENGFNFDLPSPMVKVKTTEQSLKNDRNGYYLNYLGNLHEYFDVSLQEKNLYSGKGKTPEEIYKIETLDVNPDYKSMITFQGHKGYVVCEANGSYGGYSNGPIYSYFGNYYYNYGSSSSGKDENDLTIPPTVNCTIKILEGLVDQDEQEFFMVISLTAAKESIKKSLQETFDFMSKNIEITKMGNGDTKFVNVYANQTVLKFTDLEDQNTVYKTVLKTLIHYGIIKNKSKFDAYYPMKWKDVMPIYLKAMFNVDLEKIPNKCSVGDKVCLITTASSELAGKTVNWNDLLINKMKIDLEAYVPQSKFSNFEKVLHYRLAGVPLVHFSEKEITDFENNMSEKKFKAASDALETFDNQVYGKRKITLGEVLPNATGSFQPKFNVISYQKKGIVFEDMYQDTPYNFNPEKSMEEAWMPSAEIKSLDAQMTQAKVELSRCVSKKNNLQNCIATYVIKISDITTQQQDLMLAYQVLTKAQLLDMIIGNIDFGLFDPELAKKKDTEFGEGK